MRISRINLHGYIYLAPALLLVAIFSVYPVIYSITLSFQRFDFYKLTGKWIGFANYIQLFKNPELANAFKNGLIWSFGSLAAQIVLGVTLALILNLNFFGRGFVRAMVILPFFLPGVSMSLTWRWMYYDLNGIINYILQKVGIIKDPILWLSSTKTAMLAVIFVAVWRYTPFVVINVLARLSTISKNLYEAARIDGAGSIQCFFNITLPQLRGVILIVVMLRGIWMFNKFQEIHIITGGGPLGATTTLPILAYDAAFGMMRIGEGSAINTFIFLILSVTACIYLYTFKPAKEIEV